MSQRGQGGLFEQVEVEGRFEGGFDVDHFCFLTAKPAKNAKFMLFFALFAAFAVRWRYFRGIVASGSVEGGSSAAGYWMRG